MNWEERAELIPVECFRDSRGVLKKILQLSQLEQGRIEEVYLLCSRPGSVRGNHYHLATLEYFAVVSGTASIAWQNLYTGQGERLRISAGDNMVVKVPPGVVHAIKNETEQILIVAAVSTREYCKLNPDTFPKEIMHVEPSPSRDIYCNDQQRGEI